MSAARKLFGRDAGRASSSGRIRSMPAGLANVPLRLPLATTKQGRPGRPTALRKYCTTLTGSARQAAGAKSMPMRALSAPPMRTIRRSG